MLRRILAFSLSCCLSTPAAWAFSEEQLQLEFDARLLTVEEKRFLQAGLSFANTYNGLIDGAWGPASQRALERYEASKGRDLYVTNAEVLMLALATFEEVEAFGWARQYNSGLDMSFLVPTKRFVPGAPSDNFVNMDVTGTTLGYALSVGNDFETSILHQTVSEAASGDVYQVRRPETWITSSRTRDGLTIYARSDFRRGSWSSIMLTAWDSEAGMLAAVSGSIVSYPPKIGQ